jgi:outer membrane protein
VLHSALMVRAVRQLVAGCAIVASSASVSAQPVRANDIDDPSQRLRAWAGDVQATTLPDLIAHAMTALPSLVGAKYDIAIAEAQMEIVRSREDWIVGGDLNIQPTRTFFAGVSGLQTRAELTGSLTHLLPTGGSLTIAVQTALTYQTTSGQPSSTRWNDSITATLSHPILRGRGRAIVDIARRRAELDRATAIVSQQLAAVNAVQQVVAAYWDLVLAQSEVDIARSSLMLANERLRVTQLGIAGGKIALNEDLPVLQAIATRQEEVLGDELIVVNRSIALRRATGMDIAANHLALRVEATLPTPEFDTNAIGAAIARAIKQSPELAKLANASKNTVLDVEVARNGLLPQLDAALTLGPSGSGGTAGGALAAMFTDPGAVVNASLTFRQSLENRDANGRLRVAAATNEKLAMSAADIQAQIATSLTIGLGQIELARGRLALSERTIELATRNIENEIARVSLGKSTNFDVLQRQDELKAAQLRRVRALIDGQKAIGSVMAITGELLPHYGIAAPRVDRAPPSALRSE